MVAIVDCNSFYCSCERLFQPRLHKRPVVVLSNNDGCIISRSDEARQLGIPMAGPYYMAKEVIEKHDVAVFSSNYNLYGDISRRVMETLKQIVGETNVEVYSIDESFLHLDGYSPKQLAKSARQIKETVEHWTGIPVSVGIAPTKVLSKVANRLAKKDPKKYKGVFVLDNPQTIDDALAQTAVKDIWGIGRRYAEKLESQFNLHTALALKKMNETWAGKNLGGVVGLRLWRELNGEPCIELKDQLIKKKMIACTRMFGRPVTSASEIREAVASYASRAAEKLRRQSGAAKMMEVFLVKNDHTDLYTYNPSTDALKFILPEATSATHQLINYALSLADKLFNPGSRYLKAGIILSQLVPDKEVQGNLFTQKNKPSVKLMEVMDNINWGIHKEAVHFGATGLHQKWQMKQEHRSPRYSTKWDELKTVK
ncbi:MAG: Y-family DNA polymerase [Chitinophagaceae bacterium]|jgi:DNA polymerase V|nr:Y-family DNA polymerase [Chitinophagaceae bacterium]